jgi:hypothetical protein
MPVALLLSRYFCYTILTLQPNDEGKTVQYSSGSKFFHLYFHFLPLCSILNSVVMYALYHTLFLIVVLHALSLFPHFFSSSFSFDTKLRMNFHDLHVPDIPRACVPGKEKIRDSKNRKSFDVFWFYYKDLPMKD